MKKKVVATRAWVNVMEKVVAEEVEQQLSQISSKKLAFIRPEEVVTYALNRLSPLYANSVRGLEMQAARVHRELKEQVCTAVRQGIAAVERDPLRSSTPIEPPKDEKAERALSALRRLLQDPKLDWSNLPGAVETALNDASQSPSSRRSSEASRFSGGYDLNTGRIRSRR